MEKRLRQARVEMKQEAKTVQKKECRTSGQEVHSKFQFCLQRWGQTMFLLREQTTPKLTGLKKSFFLSFHTSRQSLIAQVLYSSCLFRHLGWLNSHFPEQMLSASLVETSSGRFHHCDRMVSPQSSHGPSHSSARIRPTVLRTHTGPRCSFLPYYQSEREGNRKIWHIDQWVTSTDSELLNPKSCFLTL